MRPTRRLLTLPLAAALVAACSTATPSPTPPGPEPTPPADAAVLLRVTQVQALPPPATFSWMPMVVITLDGKVLSGGAVPAIFPGPLVGPIVERQLSASGWNKVVAAARAAGLLSGAGDFTGGQLPPGSQATRLEIVADGKVFVLTGDSSRVMQCITAPCVPQPGTPEAFGGFVNGLTDLASMVGQAELGPEGMHAPAAYAVLVGDPPDDQGLAQPPLPWPLEGGLAAFGKARADGSGGRCGIATGTDASTLRAAFAVANQLTPWRDSTDGSLHGLVVRPVLPGDGDPCEGLV